MYRKEQNINSDKFWDEKFKNALSFLMKTEKNSQNINSKKFEGLIALSFISKRQKKFSLGNVKLQVWIKYLFDVWEFAKSFFSHISVITLKKSCKFLSVFLYRYFNTSQITTTLISF